MAFEQGAGVVEVLFGIGYGGGDALKGFVEDADDPVLFGERRDGQLKVGQHPDFDVWHRVSEFLLGNRIL